MIFGPPSNLPRTLTLHMESSTFCPKKSYMLILAFCARQEGRCPAALSDIYRTMHVSRHKRLARTHATQGAPSEGVDFLDPLSIRKLNSKSKMRDCLASSARKPCANLALTSRHPRGSLTSIERVHT